MKCLGCYMDSEKSYCRKCSKRLFGTFGVSSMLDFEMPRSDNLHAFQEHSKRLSISGVQLKYSLRLESKKLVLTDTNGQYILKPIPPSRQLVAIGDLPENEHLTMQIAERVYGFSILFDVWTLRPKRFYRTGKQVGYIRNKNGKDA